MYLLRNRGPRALPRADPARRVGIRLRPRDERRRRVRRLPAAQAAPRGDAKAPIVTVRSVGYRFDATRLECAAARPSLRWRLTAWVAGVMLISAAVVFVVVYIEHRHADPRARSTATSPATPTQLVAGAQAARGHSADADRRGRQPLRARPALQRDLDAAVRRSCPGRRTVSNHPEVFGSRQTGERRDRRRAGARERVRGAAAATPHLGYSVQRIPDVGRMRVLERTVPRRRA